MQTIVVDRLFVLTLNYSAHCCIPHHVPACTDAYWYDTDVSSEHTAILHTVYGHGLTLAMMQCEALLGGMHDSSSSWRYPEYH